jgi:ureidoglycolate lyase
VIRVKLEAISREAFAPFGEIIDAKPDMSRRNHVAPVMNLRPHATANLCVVRPPVVGFPLIIQEMERHPFSTQAFLPLSGVPYLLVVAPADEAGPDLSQLRAFQVPGDRGISYGVGVWHTGMALIGQPGGMAMLVHEDGSAEDTQVQAISAVEIHV